ncbi:hypothetical protein BGZ76_010320 [Entomortierella beljakovae]|nr:hypothetical protein BGZ76_010320 [Entomortierella beljakovae]
MILSTFRPATIIIAVMMLSISTLVGDAAPLPHGRMEPSISRRMLDPSDAHNSINHAGGNPVTDPATVAGPSLPEAPSQGVPA